MRVGSFCPLKLGASEVAVSSDNGDENGDEQYENTRTEANTLGHKIRDDQGVSNNLEHCQTPLNELLINRFRVQVPVGAPK